MGELLQIHAADQFHADETDAVGFAEMVGLDDVRVDQVGDELGLADEILDEHLLAGEIGRMILMATRLTKSRAPCCSAS